MKNKLFILIMFIGIFFISVGVNDIFAYTPLETIPGITGTSFPEYVTGLHKFAIGIVALAALLMITIGGFSYMTSAGNQAQAGTSKKIITDAILGLIVVFVSWLVLNTINPDLVNDKAASPNISGLKNSGVVVTNQQKGKATQRDVYCSNGATIKCENSKEKCEEKNGEGNCNSVKSLVKDNEFIGISEGSATKYANETECIAALEINCVSGREYKNSLIYGTKQQERLMELKDKNILVIGADLGALDDAGYENLKKLGDFYKTEGWSTDNHALSLIGANKDSVVTSSYENFLEYAKEHSGIPKGNIGIFGKASYIKGSEKFYEIVDNKSDLNGYMVSDSGTVLFPGADRSNLTVDYVENDDE